MKIHANYILLFTFIFLFFAATSLHAEINYFELDNKEPYAEDFFGTDDYTVENYSADKQGGNIQYTYNYPQGSCKGTFDYSWSFSKPIDKLSVGEEFQITMECHDCAAECGFRWSSLEASGSNNTSLIRPGLTHVTDYEYNGNIYGSGTLKGWDPAANVTTVSMVAEAKKDTPWTYFVVRASEISFEFLYLYKAGQNEPPARPKVIVASQGQSTMLINVAWAGSVNADYYELQRSNADLESWSAVGTTPSIYYHDTTAEIAEKYDYRVRACNDSGGCSPYTFQKATGWRALKIPPGPVRLFRLHPTIRDLEGKLVTWGSVPEADVFNIYLAKEPGYSNSYDSDPKAFEFVRAQRNVFDGEQTIWTTPWTFFRPNSTDKHYRWIVTNRHAVAVEACAGDICSKAAMYYPAALPVSVFIDILLGD